MSIKKFKTILKFYYLEFKRQKLIKELRKKKKIKVAFLGYALGASCDLFSGIYSEFKKDKRFEPYMVIVPNSYGSKEVMIQIQNQAKEYLDGLKIPYVCGYDEKNDTFVNVTKTISPDIVFMCHHYNWFPKEFRIENFAEKLVYITPYSYFLDDNLGYNANTKAYLYAHKCFFESPELSECWKNASCIKKNKEGEYLGYLKVDTLLFNNDTYKDVWKIKDKSIKRIIWAPHHLDAPLSNFLEYKDLFLNLAKARTDIQFAFRPHPGLKGSLQRIAGWTSAECDEYFKKWQNLPNTFISEGDFGDLFLSSDAMILDSISFIAEYTLVDKPICVQAPKSCFKFNSFAERLKSVHYSSTSFDEVLLFINDVVCANNDIKKSQRRQVINDSFLSSNNKPASHNIYQYICNEIFKESLI